ncbi:alpha-glucosidase [Flavobacterium degerlachei]|jgi:trehalose-6-phosphate hydrolase|uniref:Trehalose-6-phosphate hydrolase n=1 Tax=Flavobacterium degerlachei TaxID=229203 RepID=A0A1H2SQB8_9FLAO|nr:alpha-glucosidase [Flavobacterium degerlachei]SDW33655.1 trehalose-6-phosphate hydrolase [Flavobacterium degerlachei]
MKLIKPIVLLPIIFLLFSCNKEKKTASDKVWWKETVFYEVYMPSYKDSNGDGFSDFKGFTSKLDYIESLGVKGIWLTPFLESPKVDNGYDVSNYYKVDPTYGSLKDFKQFLEEAHKKDIKIIMDLVVNHTSTDSKWFQESRKSKDNPYRDYYIWKDKPNNWESFFGASAWELDKTTNQYYYHQFDTRMADLNWGNPKVVAEIQNVLRFWLDLGVDGFRLDVINFLTTDGITKDNPTKDGAQEHLNDINQKGVKTAMKSIKSVVNEYDNRFIVGEIGSDKIEVLKQYQSPELLDVVFNFNFGSIKEFSAKKIYDELQSMEKNMKSYPTLFFGSHDMPRLIDRLAKDSPQRAEALAALMLTAKGVPFIYYGEEIGMENIKANTIAEMMDVQGRINYNLAIKAGKSEAEALTIGNEHNRDKSRSPMQWNAEYLAGFSDKSSWIKVNPNYTKINVASLEAQNNSLLNRYKKLITLRNTEAVLQYGKYSQLSFSNDCISFVRTYNGENIKCYFNFSANPLEVIVKSNQKILEGKAQIQANAYLIIKG